MSFFSSIGSERNSAVSSAISIVSTSSTLSSVISEVDESSKTEKELTKKITAAEIEIENFSLEPDESFFDNTTNKTKD